MNMYRLVLVSAMAAGLFACDRPALDAADAPGTAEANPADEPFNANVGGMPHIRAGYWAVSTTNEGITVASTMCIDDAIQERMSVFGQDMTGGMCERATISPRAGGGWTSVSQCPLGAAGDMVVTMNITGDMRSTYKTHMVITHNGQPSGTPHISEGRYQGACPAGMNTGDVIMEGGLKLNLDQVAGMTAGMGKMGR